MPAGIYNKIVKSTSCDTSRRRLVGDLPELTVPSFCRRGASLVIYEDILAFCLPVAFMPCCHAACAEHAGCGELNGSRLMPDDEGVCGCPLSSTFRCVTNSYQVPCDTLKDNTPPPRVNFWAYFVQNSPLKGGTHNQSGGFGKVSSRNFLPK